MEMPDRIEPWGQGWPPGADDDGAGDGSGADAAPAGALRAAIVQDVATNRVLMLAWMDDEALRLTRETGEAHFFSRSRGRLWHKGETSGNTLAVEELREDCDGDAVLLRVRPRGPACHTGARSCFSDVPPRTLDKLYATLQSRFAERPEGSYSASLFDAGRAKILKKVNEEATEVVIAASHETRERLVSELADLVYHVSALMVNEGVSWQDVEDELARRER